MESGKTVRRELLKIIGAGAGSAALANVVSAQTPSGPSSVRIYNAKTFGATGDGKTIDTPSIDEAIEAAANAGGSTVLFPGGTYLSYSIHLKSHVILYLEGGAQIVAAGPLPPGSTGGYDAAEPNQWEKHQDFGHNHWHNSLIWGEGLENVSILGPPGWTILRLII